MPRRRRTPRKGPATVPSRNDDPNPKSLFLPWFRVSVAQNGVNICVFAGQYRRTRLGHFLPLGTASIDVATVFESTHHPKDESWGLVYTRFLARPLGVCTVPLMVGATTSALLEQPIWAYLVWGLPAAIALATVWTHFSMSRTPAEVGFRPGQAAVRSVYDVLVDHPRDWKPIFNVRTTSFDVELAIGRTTYLLQPPQWHEFPALRTAAREAFRPEAAASSHA